ARLGQGGQLAGLTVAPGRAAVLSEESRDDWDTRCKRLQIGEYVRFFCRPFPTKPTLAQWQTMIAAMLMLKRQERVDLLVIDPLAVFNPGTNENTAEAMLECLIPLRELTSLGLAVLILHHPSKGNQLAGQAARGSGALASYVDILIEKSWFREPDETD